MKWARTDVRTAGGASRTTTPSVGYNIAVQQRQTSGRERETMHKFGPWWISEFERGFPKVGRPYRLHDGGGRRHQIFEVDIFDQPKHNLREERGVCIVGAMTVLRFVYNYLLRI